jgi:hypothetical protein
MRRWLKKLGISVKDYLDWQGEGPLDPETNKNRRATLKDFAERNPDWPLRAWVGLLMETFIDAGQVEVTAAGPQIEDLLMVRWHPFPRCDRWALGRIVEVSDDMALMKVSYFAGITSAGQPYDYASSSGCVKDCTDGCDDFHGLPGGSLLRVQRAGLIRLEKREPLVWLVWDDAVEVVQALPEDTTAA